MHTTGCAGMQTIAVIAEKRSHFVLVMDRLTDGHYSTGFGVVCPRLKIATTAGVELDN